VTNIITDEALLQYINLDHSIHYINTLFKNTIDIDQSWMVEVRKIGQYRKVDGTTEPAEQCVAAQLLQFDQMNPIPGLAQWVADKVRTAAPIGIGAFMAPALLNDRRATDASVVRMLSVCADFDTGNPKEKLDALCMRLGIRPTMVATSGGTTSEGHAKLHAHWRMDEPCDEPWKIAYIREQIAKNFGADSSFKRIPQIIRIPGALYDKGGNWGTTLIIEYNDHDTSVQAWEDCFNIDWDNLADDSIFNRASIKTKEEKVERLHKLHTEEIHAGGTEETRFSRFSEYAGHQIKQARFGHQTVEEAFQSVTFWVNDKMVPAWDPQRVDVEFTALLQRDKINHEMAWAERDKPPITFGNTPTPAGQYVQPLPGSPVAEKAPEVQSFGNMPWVKMFDAALLYAGHAPKERHLIENFLVHQSSAALVADGGVGKTYLAIELALRAAAGPMMFGETQNNFMGFNILERMNVIVFTVEDGQHDIHRRICAIDMDGSLRAASAGHCFIIPVQEQILDGLTLAEKDSKGNFGPSRAWKAVQEHIKEAIDTEGMRGLPLLVIIDTYSATHHGDENAAIGTNEWFRAAGMLRQFEATLLLTHHVRKADPKMEIKTPSDMKAAVRGSSAFLNSVRICYGVWEMPHSDAVTKEMPPEEQNTRLFNMGILKNNTGISWEDRSDPRYPDPMITLRRLGSGRLVYDALIHGKRIDLTAGKPARLEAARAQLKASIVHAVRWYAEQGWPLSQRNLTKDKEQFLPPKIRDMSRDKEINPIILEMLANGTLKQIAIKGKSTGGSGILDVPEGAYSVGTQTERRSDVPAMQWSHFKYDEENEVYLEVPNVQHIMDL